MKNFYENKIMPLILFVFLIGFFYFILWRLGTFNIFINYFLTIFSIFFVFFNLNKKITKKNEYEKGSILLSVVILFLISTSTLIAFLDIQIKEFWTNQTINQLNEINKNYLKTSKLDLDSYTFQNCREDLDVIVSSYDLTSKYDLQIPIDDSGLPIFENIEVDFGDYSGYRLSELIVNNSESNQPGWDWYSSAKNRLEILNEIFETNTIQEQYLYQNTLELCSYWQVFNPYSYANRGFVFSPTIRNLYLNK